MKTIIRDKIGSVMHKLILIWPSMGSYEEWTNFAGSVGLAEMTKKTIR
jgi:hypothetical protein